MVCDETSERAQKLAQAVNATATTDPDEVFQNPQIDAVIVATTHDSLAPLALRAIQSGKHVLVEKPAARTTAELLPLIAEAEARRLIVRVGYNHRFHPAIQMAQQLIEGGKLGPLMFMRARYGHGGRLGYENEWRADPVRSGGGELIDQGVHLIDLARWFFGDFPHVRGTVKTFFWNMAVEDNVFLELETAGGQVAWMHASCTEWKNLFSIEIYGRDAKLQIDGLGGSYGPERLIHYQMKPEMGPPETEIHDFPAGDFSWKLEVSEFEQDILRCRAPSPGLRDAAAVLNIMDRVYEQCDVAWRHK